METVQLSINAEFEKLIPPLTKEEFEQLEKNILAEGIRDPLVVWSKHKGEDFLIMRDHILIDGHNRFRIAEKHNLEYDIVEKEFKNEHFAKMWIVQNQFGRRNLSIYDRSILALQFETFLKQATRENLIKSGQYYNQNRVSQISEKPANGNDTWKEMAKISGVSHDTLAKVKKIETRANEELKSKLKNNKISIDKAYQEVKKEEKKQEVRKKEDEHKEEIATVSEFDIDIFTTDRKFNIIYADPAWKYWDGGEKNQSLHYSTMTIEEIKNLPVANITDRDCILFIWVTFPILKESLEVIESWGFKYSTCGFVWVKKNKNADTPFFGNGAWTRANSELCLIATKGSITRIDASISQVLEDPISEHSKKPERVRSLITKLVGELPRIELFSRNTNNDGWFNWGNKI